MHLHDSVLLGGPVGALPCEEGLCFKQGTTVSDVGEQNG